MPGNIQIRDKIVGLFLESDTDIENKELDYSRALRIEAVGLDMLPQGSWMTERDVLENGLIKGLKKKTSDISIIKDLVIGGNLFAMQLLIILTNEDDEENQQIDECTKLFNEIITMPNLPEWVFDALYMSQDEFEANLDTIGQQAQQAANIKYGFSDVASADHSHPTPVPTQAPTPLAVSGGAPADSEDPFYLHNTPPTHHQNGMQLSGNSHAVSVGISDDSGGCCNIM